MRASDEALRPRILIVDDDPLVRRTLRRAFTHHGFEVVVADGGPAAVDAVGSVDPIDLVLLDLSMPEMDGEETLRALRSVRPGLRALLMTGYTEKDAARNFAEVGFEALIPKPFSAREIAKDVRQLLRLAA